MGGMERELENPGDLFSPSIRLDGILFQIRAPQGGMERAPQGAPQGGMERELENPGDPFFPSIRSDGTVFRRAPQGGGVKLHPAGPGAKGPEVHPHYSQTVRFSLVGEGGGLLRVGEGGLLRVGEGSPTRRGGGSTTRKGWIWPF